MERLQELQSKLPVVLRQQEDILAERLSTPEAHFEEDRMNLRTDLRFSIRRFVDSASASISSNITPKTPSFQVSSLGATDSTGASILHRELPLRDLELVPLTTSGPLQVFVRNVGQIKPLSLQIDSEATIEQLKGHVRDRIGLPGSRFQFVHRGRLIAGDGDKTLRECGITKDDTFTCVSFDAGNVQPIPPWPLVSIKITIKTLAGQDCLWIPPYVKVRVIKARYVQRFNPIFRNRTGPRHRCAAYEIDLLYKGTILEDESHILLRLWGSGLEWATMHAMYKPPASSLLQQPPRPQPTKVTGRNVVRLGAAVDKIPSLIGPFGIP